MLNFMFAMYAHQNVYILLYASNIATPQTKRIYEHLPSTPYFQILFSFLNIYPLTSSGYSATEKFVAR